MTRRAGFVLASLATLAVAACEPPSPPAGLTGANVPAPAAADVSDPLSALTVASVGGGRGKQSVVFLNSMADYRDPRNLSVMVRPAAARELELALGGPLKDKLDGRTISVRGEVQRVEIEPRPRKPSGEAGKGPAEPWFQNRIEVTSASQIVLN